MKNTIYLSLFFIILFYLSSSCKSTKQSTTPNTTEEQQFYSTWYIGERISSSRIKISDNLMISQGALTGDLTTTTAEELEEFSWSVGDTLKIEKAKFVKEKNTFFATVSKRKDRKEYKGFSIENTPIKGIKLMIVTDNHYFTMQEAENDIDTIAFKEILQVPIFDKSFQVSSLKSIKDFTKEEYIVLIKYMNSIAPAIEGLSNKLEAQGEVNYQAFVEKILDDNFIKKIYLLGYNPYFDANENPFIELNKDPEIMELLKIE